jgi:hypothetical protein
MAQGSFARVAMVASALAAGLLLGAIGRADGPHLGGAPLQAATPRPLDMGLVLDTQGKHPGIPPLDFRAMLRNNTTT